MTPLSEIESLRARLDGIDDQLAARLADRMRVVNAIGRIKAEKAQVVRDEGREQAILERIKQYAHNTGADAAFITNIFNHIFEHSLHVQLGQQAEHQPSDKGAITIAYQGGEGSYSQLAATEHFALWPSTSNLTGYETFGDVITAVRTQRADFCMLPVENTTAGSINEVYDLLGTAGLEIVGEQVQIVDHCLVGIPGADPQKLQCIKSHPQALAQCSEFLRTMTNARVEAFVDTALAALDIHDRRDPTHAAIASAEAAGKYDLEILHRHVANQPENYTRFVVVGREPLALRPDIPLKTSIVFDTSHEPGALSRCVDTLAEHGLNLTKLESRPIPQMPWKYRFYVDFVTSDPRPTRSALAEMHEHTRSLVVLGTYAANITSPPPNADPGSG